MLTVTIDQSEGISGADIPEQAVKKMRTGSAALSLPSSRAFFAFLITERFSTNISELGTGYHLVCIWGSLGKFQGGGVVLKFICIVLECGFPEFLYRCLPLSFKAQCLPQIEGGLCLARCVVVAQTQAYHLVGIWGSQVKFQGVGLF